jgi:hypothetical protein
MATATLPDAIQVISELSIDDQKALYDYLHDTLTTNGGGNIIQIGGTLGVPIPEEAGDPIADALAELRRERAAHFDEEWTS